MVGNLVLKNCLNNPEIKTVTIITRRKSGIKNTKLVEVIHDDFTDFSKIKKFMKNQDMCLYCIGVYTGQVPNEEFTKITVDYTEAFAEAFHAQNKHATFCFLSGQGADQSEKSRMIFARDKGRAEKFLLTLGFEHTYIFRPGYIYPVTPRKEPNISYAIIRILYKAIFSKMKVGFAVSSEHLAKAMIEAGLHGAQKSILENKDILNIRT